MSYRRRRCKSCLAFDPLPDDGVYEADGICRMNPPRDGWPVTWLDAWCLQHKLPPKKKERVEKKKSDHQLVMDFYQNQFVESANYKPTITGRDGAAVKRMLSSKVEVEEIKAVIAEFFRDPPKYNVENNLYGLADIETQFNKITHRLSQKDKKDDRTLAMRLVDEQAIKHGNHELWRGYYEFVEETGERLTFEEFLDEYH